MVGLPLIASLMLLLVCLSGPATSPQPPQVFAALLAFALEQRAVSLQGSSYFSAAPSLYLALLCQGQLRLAAFTGLVSFVSRWAVRERFGSKALQAGARDLCSLLAAAAVARYHSHPAVVLDAYLLAWLLWETLAGQETSRLRARLRLLWFVQLLFALVWLQLDTWAGWLAASLTPWALQYAAHRSLEGYRAEEREDLRGHLQRSLRQVGEEREERARLERILNARIAESTWRAEVQRELAQVPDLRTWTERVFRLLRAVAWLRSTALLEVDAQGRWSVRAQRSPEGGRLDALALLSEANEWLTRPEPGWLQGRPLLPEEEQALAVRLDETRVLYAGSAAHPVWTSQQQELLQLVAACARESWPNVLHLQSLLDRAGSARVLEQQLDVLHELLTRAKIFSARLDAGQVVEQLLEACRSFPGQSRSLAWWQNESLHFVVGGAAEEPAASVARSGKPLLLDDVVASRFDPLRPGERSLLAVPLQTDQETVGVVLLGAAPPRAFAREHQDRLQLLGMLAAQALRNAQLHAQVLEALRRQRESEAQLIQSSKMAAVGQLAAGVAHELNTPIGTVVLALDALAYRVGDNPLMKTAQAAAEQARSIVSKLLYYSRDARVGLRSADLNAMVNDTLQLLGQQLKLDKVDVHLNLQPLPEISVNQNEIQQVVTNLLLNARDALGEQRWIELATRVEGAHVVLRIRDGGCGVPPEVANRIFEPFFTTKPVGKGTGLGLSVSHQIVQAHGGELVLESAADPTCFAVRLPLADEGGAPGGD